MNTKVVCCLGRGGLVLYGIVLTGVKDSSDEVDEETSEYDGEDLEDCDMAS
jgi:hypothetical protein